MKAKIMLGILVVTVGTAFGVATLEGGPDPNCIPNKPCRIEQKHFDGGPIPVCRPNVPCPVRK